MKAGQHSVRFFPNIKGDVLGGWDDAIDDQAAGKLKSLQFLRWREGFVKRRFSAREKMTKFLRYRGEIRLESDGARLLPNSKRRFYMQAHSALDAMVSVRVYRSPKQTSLKTFGDCKERKGYSQVFSMLHEILCLGSNTLTELRDEIRCSNDRLALNDCSAAPNSTGLRTAKPIREYAAQRGVSGLTSVPMTGVRLRDLTVRLGYPYAYVHQGDCQHLIVFSDVR